MLSLANGLPRVSIGHYTGLGQRILLELNPNILVRDAIRMSIVRYIALSAQDSDKFYNQEQERDVMGFFFIYGWLFCSK